MDRLLQCISQEHEFWLLAVAVLVCVSGSALSVRIARRIRSAQPGRRRTQLLVSALFTGTTIWSTHLIAMLAYDPGVPHGFEIELTALSFVVALLGTLAANATLTQSNPLPWALAGGVLFGGAIALTHYIGMEAFAVPGRLDWDMSLKATSVILGAVFATLAFHRTALPVTRYCWIGGTVFMALSITSMHLIGMAAIVIELNPLVTVPAALISDTVLGAIVFTVTALVLAIGFAMLSIETTIEGEAKSKLAHNASHDHLTGIPNRVWLTEFMEASSLSQPLDQAPETPPTSTAIIALDLDGFKQVNDLHGHSFGDMVLMTVARRLAATCATDEHITRSGSDEFTAIKTHFANVAEVEEFARRLLRAIAAPIPAPASSVSGRDIRLAAWVGYATSLLDADISAGLIQKADFAMHRAKAARDRRLSAYNAEMSAHARDKLMLVQDLRRAAVQQELQLVYQLQHELEGLEPIGCEALLRWHHPDRGVVSPATFIPIAEETGLICKIGLWVLRTACLEAASWTRPLSLAVNVAPQQLVEPDFLEDLADVLFESNLAPERLELEVTEASVISDQETTLDIIQRIKQMGVRIAMDDFGTGYSSLATLQAFPFDKIKIDRSFVTDIDRKPQSAAIVRATLLLGRALDIPVLAEGVENEEELAFLRKERCAYVQGYYFGRPLSLPQMRQIACSDDPQKSATGPP